MGGHHRGVSRSGVKWPPLDDDEATLPAQFRSSHLPPSTERTFVERQGWTLVSEHRDIASGKDDRRPGFPGGADTVPAVRGGAGGRTSRSDVPTCPHPGRPAGRRNLDPGRRHAGSGRPDDAGLCCEGEEGAGADFGADRAALAAARARAVLGGTDGGGRRCRPVLRLRRRPGLRALRGRCTGLHLSWTRGGQRGSPRTRGWRGLERGRVCRRRAEA